MAYRPEWDEGRPASSGYLGFGASSPAPATRLIIISCVVMFLLQFVLDIVAPPDPLTRYLGLSTGTAPFLLPFVSYMFLHDPHGFFHIIFNMLWLYFFGRDLEITLGTRKYLGVYFGSGIVGGVVYLAWCLFSASARPVIGASAGVIGVLVFSACLYPNRRVIFFFFPMKIWQLVALFVGLDLMTGLQDLAGRYAGASAWPAHLGGGAWGLLVWWLRFDPTAWFAGLKKRTEASRRRREHRQEIDESREMDRLLQKIHSEGLGSLTAREKRFLDRVSRDLKGRH